MRWIAVAALPVVVGILNAPRSLSRPKVRVRGPEHEFELAASLKELAAKIAAENAASESA